MTTEPSDESGTLPVRTFAAKALLTRPLSLTSWLSVVPEGVTTDRLPVLILPLLPRMRPLESTKTTFPPPLRWETFSVP